MVFSILGCGFVNQTANKRGHPEMLKQEIINYPAMPGTRVTEEHDTESARDAGVKHDLRRVQQRVNHQRGPRRALPPRPRPHDVPKHEILGPVETLFLEALPLGLVLHRRRPPLQSAIASSTAVRAGIAHGREHTAAGSTPAAAALVNVPAGPVHIGRRLLRRPHRGLHGAKGVAFGLDHAHLDVVHFPVPVVPLRGRRGSYDLYALLGGRRARVLEPRRGGALAAALGGRHGLGGARLPLVRDGGGAALERDAGRGHGTSTTGEAGRGLGHGKP